MQVQDAASATVTSAPLSPLFGVELHGIDLRAGVTDEQMSSIVDAVNHHSLVLLRNQSLRPEDQAAFSKRLGTPRVSFFNSRFAPDGVQELTTVSNIERDGKPIGVVDAGAMWHSDASYLPCPDLYTILYAVQVPHRDGEALGDTMFTSTRVAHSKLSPELQHRLSGLRALNSFAYHMDLRNKKRLTQSPVPGEVKDVAPDSIHPVVRHHPITGEKCLFVTEGHTKCIMDVDPSESERLLASLLAHITQPEFVYRHRWKEGDLLVWDNCATQHLAITDYGQIPRLLYRAGIAGPVPV